MASTSTSSLSPADRRLVEALADLALAADSFAVSAELGVIVVAEVVRLAAIVDGYDTGHPIELRRSDGRAAYLYALPAEALAEVRQ